MVDALAAISSSRNSLRASMLLLLSVGMTAGVRDAWKAHSPRGHAAFPCFLFIAGVLSSVDHPLVVHVVGILLLALSIGSLLLALGTGGSHVGSLLLALSIGANHQRAD